MGELVEERDRLREELTEHRELLHKALDRPSLLERLLRALRGSPGLNKDRLVSRDNRESGMALLAALRGFDGAARQVFCPSST